MIKKFLLIFILLVGVSYAYGDVIVKKDGTTMEVYNIDLGEKYITFTTEASPESQIGRVLRDDCFAIKGADGVMKNVDAVDISNNQEQTKVESKFTDIELSFSDNAKAANKELLSKHNKRFEFSENAPIKRDKEAKAVIRQFGLTDSSIIRTDELQLEIWIPEVSIMAKKDIVMAVNVINICSDVVYIDLGNTFFVENGNSECIYVPSSSSVSSSRSTGVSANLGNVADALGVGGVVGTLASGVNVGGGNGNTTSETVYSQRIIAIPPGAKKTIFERKIFEYSDTEPVSFSCTAAAVRSRWSNKKLQGTILDYNFDDWNGKAIYGVFVKYSKTENLTGPTKTIKAEYYPIRDLFCAQKNEDQQLEKHSDNWMYIYIKPHF
ncbi:MAG: hypothetical protein NC411_05940 [Bacteroides sp.]|nr:hypothetical protein [Bacteroides sp.]